MTEINIVADYDESKTKFGEILKAFEELGFNNVVIEEINKSWSVRKRFNDKEDTEKENGK